jgi:hypothetical protein
MLRMCRKSDTAESRLVSTQDRKNEISPDRNKFEPMTLQRTGEGLRKFLRTSRALIKGLRNAAIPCE